jgi:hypothetical protein
MKKAILILSLCGIFSLGRTQSVTNNLNPFLIAVFTNAGSSNGTSITITNFFCPITNVLFTNIGMIDTNDIWIFTNVYKPRPAILRDSYENDPAPVTPEPGDQTQL